MGKRRRCTGLGCCIFNPMGMGMGIGIGKKKCALFNPMRMGMGMGMGKRRRRCGGILNPIGMGRRRKRCGDGDLDLPLLFLLPEDVLIKILVCLPVKSLLRFKSVCKSWRELIESSFFIDLHTTTTTSTFNSSSSSSSSSSKFGAFIIQTREFSNKYEDDIKLYKLSSGDHGEDDDDKEDDDDDQKMMVFKVDDLCFLPFYKDYLLCDTLRMVGSCNGIICLHDPKVMDDDRGRSKQHYTNLRDVCLWNPATRQFRILPKSIPIKVKNKIRWLEDFIGFGFDVKTKDYKVLRITPLWDYESEKGGGCMCRVQVYSLSTDSWRLLEGGINSLPVHPTSLPVHPDEDLFRNTGIYLNGSYFFVGNKSNTQACVFMLMSFDFTKEIFTTMQLPPENDSIRHGMVLSSLGEKLALFDDCYDYYDVWVLKNEQHGSGLGVLNKESWTKLHSNLLFPMKGKTEGFGKPGCISNNGEFALISTWENDKLLQLFNLVTKEAIKDFTIGRVCRAEVYKESLVSIMGGGGGGNVLLRWQLPAHGTCYKLNLDAPFIDSYFAFGIGLCLTSDTGGCIGVRSLSRYVSNAKEGEALAMLEAIKWAKKLELSPIIIESDSKNIVSFFMDDDDNDNNNSTYWSSKKALSLLRKAKLL